MITPTHEERFLEKVEKEGPILRIPLTRCHQWQGAKSGDGYGLIRVGHRCVGAHRFAYEMHLGEIPKGPCVCHVCDNPLCVNPAHLFLGTTADNMHDRDAKGRARGGNQRGEKHPSAKLTDEDVLEIRHRFARGGVLQRDLAKEYKVSRSYVSCLLGNKYRAVA